MKRRLLFLLVLIAVAVLALPVANLVAKLPLATRLTEAAGADTLFARAAMALERKCWHCHAEGAALPFYAGWPVARTFVQADIKKGLDWYDLVAELAALTPPTEAALAKLEYTVVEAKMPPGRFLALHWDGKLTGTERTDILAWIRTVRRQRFAAPGQPPEVQERVLQPLTPVPGLDPAKVALGRRLFNEPRLSKDDSTSCASCHDLAKGGTDRERFSTGVGGVMGDINSPTVFNAVYQFRQFWDGRAADLVEQADGPMNNPAEMASNWPLAIGKLAKDPAFMAEYRAVYGGDLLPANLLEAIAEFEKSLVTTGSRLDKYLAGETQALTAEEKQGHDLFLARGCAGCHPGRLLGGRSFEKMGRQEDYFARRGNPGKADDGRFNVTKLVRDRRRFKVPTLRNIAQTAPYFHDGTVGDLGEAVRIMGGVQLDESLEEGEAGLIAGFLKTLTGVYEGKPVR